MRKSLPRIAQVLSLLLLAVPLMLFCQTTPGISAKIWAYESCSKFTDPPHSSGYKMKYTDEKVTTEVTNASTFEQKHGHPAAVCVTFRNSMQTPMDVLVDKDLAGVSLVSKEGGTAPALAKRAMMEGPMGGPKMEFVTKSTASFVINLAAGEEVNIVYLFARAKAGDTIRIGKFGPVTIK